MWLKSLARKSCMLLLSSLSSIYKAGGIPILTYHSIDDSGSILSNSPTLFQNQMRFLKENNFSVISLRKLIDTFRSHTKPLPRSVVLTFDDGYKNNYEVAFPILKELNFTATFFIVTEYVGRRSTWGEEGALCDVPLLSWEEILKMATHGMDIQPHSCTHPYLTQIAKDEMIREMRDSRLRIEEAIQKEADIFCYPFGEYDHRCIELLSHLGFKGAVSIEFGKSNSVENIYALQRVGSAHFQDMTAFKVSLYGLYEWYLFLRNAVH